MGAELIKIALIALCMMTTALAWRPAIADEWQFQLTPYLWLAGIKGEFGNGVAGGQPPHVDASFDNLLSSLDMLFMGSFEARNGRWGVLGDLVYLSFSKDASIKLAPNLPSPGVKLNAELDGTVFSLGATYRVATGATAVDVLGGLRYYSLRPSVNVTIGPVQRAVEPNSDWTDPIVGMRVRHEFSPKWALNGYADVGGFGVGSDFTYQVYLGMEYAFSRTFSANLGYRQLHFDYQKDNSNLNLTFGGAMLGLGVRF
jgi:opacity protein-like surface antigen